MKKLLFTLLTAVCCAGAASAVVSSSWTEVTTDTSMPTTFTSSFSIGMVLSITDVDTFVSNAYSTLVSVYNTKDSGTGPSFYAYTDGVIGGKGNDIAGSNNGDNYNGKGTYQSHDNSTTTTTTSIADLFKTNKVEGEYSVALTVEMYTNTNNKLCSVYTLYINGHQAFTTDHEDIGSTVYSYAVETFSNASAIYYMNDVASTKDIASLPEPTALALLALGAAGLALRRKVA